MQYNTYKGSTTITSFKISCVLYEILIIFIFTIFYSIFKIKITYVCTLKKKKKIMQQYLNLDVYFQTYSNDLLIIRILYKHYFS